MQKTSVFTVLFARRVSKNRENTTYLTIFGHYGTETAATTTTRRTKTTRKQTTATTKATATATTPATTTKTSKFMIRVMPAGPRPQRISEDIPDNVPERIAENI